MDFWYEPRANSEQTVRLSEEWAEFASRLDPFVDLYESIEKEIVTHENTEEIRVSDGKRLVVFRKNGSVEIGIDETKDKHRGRGVIDIGSMNVQMTIPDARVEIKAPTINIWDNDKPVTGDLKDDEWWEENMPEMTEEQKEAELKQVEEEVMSRWVRTSLGDPKRTSFSWEVERTREEMNRDLPFQ